MLSTERSLNLQLITCNRRMDLYVKKVFRLFKAPRSYHLAESIRGKYNALDPKYFPPIIPLPNLRNIKDPEARYEVQVLEVTYLQNLNEFVVVLYHVEQSIHEIKSMVILHEPKFEVESYFTDTSNIVVLLRSDIPNKKKVRDLLYEKIEHYLANIAYQRCSEKQFIVPSGKPKSCNAAGITNKTFRERCFWLISLKKGSDNSMQVEFGSMRITLKIVSTNEKTGPGVIEQLYKDSNPYFTTALLTLEDWSTGLGKGKEKLPLIRNKASLFEYSLNHLRDYELKFVQQKLDERLDKFAATQDI